MHGKLRSTSSALNNNEEVNNTSISSSRSRTETYFPLLMSSESALLYAYTQTSSAILFYYIEGSHGTSPDINGSALYWFKSYLFNRTQFISYDQTKSEPSRLTCGVRQGSCLGPLLFILYASKLFEAKKQYLPQAHAYADDTQLYLSFNADKAFSESNAIEAMEKCIKGYKKLDDKRQTHSER